MDQPRSTWGHENLWATLASMGEAVITTDRAGCIKYMNAVAEALTGWTLYEAAGRPIDAVFETLCDQSREPLENPVAKVLRTTEASSSRNAVLVAKTRKESFVDAAAAFSRDRSGDLNGCILVFRDVSDRRRVELALRRSEQLYRSLVDSQAEMLCRFRRDGTIIFANSAYATAQGTAPDELIGRNLWSFLPEAERPRVESLLDELTPEAPEISIENRLDTVGGERWTLWTNRALAFDEKGRMVEAQSAGIDITQRKNIERALQEADRRKDEFLATLAHELRDPLAPIGNSLQILKQAGDDSELAEKAQHAIGRQISHLVRLVDDLLDVSRITRDKLELRRSRVELGVVVRQSVDTCEAAARENGLTIEMRLPRAPVYLNADPVRLAQIFNNLLNNACKYTPRGGYIQVTAKQLDGDAVISVKDSGMGVPGDRLESIFEMFKQVPQRAGQPTGGLGIGLTLVKRLVELHEGSITATSPGIGKGSEFLVRLPVIIDDQRRRPKAATALPDRRGQSLRILVVDDNRDSADSLAALLQLNGHETHVAYDGLAAVREARVLGPQVVLLDRGLPLLDGAAACRRIREAPWGKGIVMVAVTGWGQEEDRRKSEEAGFDHHLIKPVNLEKLKELLAAVGSRDTG
ncbi:MAG: PAS domain S-box protein [Woeseia sp.]